MDFPGIGNKTSDNFVSQNPGGGKQLNVKGLPPALAPYKDAIMSAAQKAGIDPNLLAAQIWAESRGNPNEASTNPEDGQPDIGLMQISQSTYDNYVRKNDPSAPPLDVRDPVQNILAGALELKAHIKENGGNVNAGLQDYVGSDPDYVPRVSIFYEDMVKGIQMPDQDPV